MAAGLLRFDLGEIIRRKVAQKPAAGCIARISSKVAAEVRHTVDRYPIASPRQKICGAHAPYPKKWRLFAA